MLLLLLLLFFFCLIFNIIFVVIEIFVGAAVAIIIGVFGMLILLLLLFFLSLNTLEPLINIKKNNNIIAKDILFEQFNSFCNKREKQINNLISKKKKTNEIKIINDFYSESDFENLQMSLEDYYSNVVEESELLQQVVGIIIIIL